MKSLDWKKNMSFLNILVRMKKLNVKYVDDYEYQVQTKLVKELQYILIL